MCLEQTIDEKQRVDAINLNPELARNFGYIFAFLTLKNFLTDQKRKFDLKL